MNKTKMYNLKVNNEQVIKECIEDLLSKPFSSDILEIDIAPWSKKEVVLLLLCDKKDNFTKLCEYTLDLEDNNNNLFMDIEFLDGEETKGFPIWKRNWGWL